MSTLRLACINIEKNKYAALLRDFLESFSPDILCLQEVYESDFFLFQEHFDMRGTFAPTIKVIQRGQKIFLGVCILSKAPLTNIVKTYYKGSEDRIPDYVPGVQGLANKVLLRGVVEGVTIGTTQFTWSADGMATDTQRKDLQNLLKTLRDIPDIIFCGDFNAPRGREIFTMIAKEYIDHIPSQYTTSIDKNLHRAGDLQLMVDGLFSTPDYEVTDVELIDGVSDHMAITARIARRSSLTNLTEGRDRQATHSLQR